MRLTPDQLRELGQRLIELRGPRSQREIAAQCDVSEAAYRQWEHGKSQPRYGYIERLAEIHSVSVEYISEGRQIAATNNDNGRLERIERELHELRRAVEGRSSLSDREHELLERLARWVERQEQGSA